MPDANPLENLHAFTASVRNQPMTFQLMLNAFWEPLEFELPPTAGPWRRWIDTFLPAPEDIAEWQKAPLCAGGTYRAGPRSVVVLYAVSG